MNFCHEIFNDPTKYILFFVQITLLITFSSSIVSIYTNYLNKNIEKNSEYLLISYYRLISVVFSVIFVFSSYFILTATNKLVLYLFSGAHYFIISFFQLIIRLELSTYNNDKNNITITEANNYFGFCLNFAGIISIFIFSIFYEKALLTNYSTYCIYVEIIFILYLLFVRKYYNDIKIIITSCATKKVLSYIAFACIGILSAMMLSIFIMSIGVIAPLISLAIILILYKNFSKTLESSDLKLIVNISLGYGLILSVMTSSILIYFLHNNKNMINIFNFTYSLEPLFALIIGAVMAWRLMKNNISFSRYEIYKKTYFITYMIPFLFIIFYGLLIASPNKTKVFLVTLFVTYAFIEYTNTFFLRQVAQLNNYNLSQGTQLTNFYTIVLNGLCPSLIYILIYLCANYTHISLDQILVNTIIALTLISLFYNIVFKHIALSVRSYEAV